MVRTTYRLPASKLIAVYIYEDTPIGEAKITILGELKSYVDDGGVVRDVPDEWKNVFDIETAVDSIANIIFWLSLISDLKFITIFDQKGLLKD